MLTGTPAYTPPVTRATFRRSAIAAAVVAVVALAVLIPMGLGLYAVFGAVGLGLGVLNSWLVMRAVVNFAATQPSKMAFSRSVFGRLALITVLALALRVGVPADRAGRLRRSRGVPVHRRGQLDGAADQGDP